MRAHISKHRKCSSRSEGTLRAHIQVRLMNCGARATVFNVNGHTRKKKDRQRDKVKESLGSARDLILPVASSKLKLAAPSAY